MDLSNIFGGDPAWEECPRHPDAPHVPQSDVTTLYPSAALAGHPDRATLGIVGRVHHESVLSEHVVPGPAWWRRVMALMVILKRMAFGPLYSDTVAYTEGGLDWIHADTVFDVVSVSGYRLTLAAPDVAWDARRFAVATKIHENSLYYPGGPYAHYLLYPVMGTFQFGDDVIPAANSVLYGKSRPCVVAIEYAAEPGPGENFVLVLDQDVTNIAELADPDGAAADTVTVRVHATLPEFWPELRDFDDFSGVSRSVAWPYAQIQALAESGLDAGATRLRNDAGAHCRIAYPRAAAGDFSGTFQVRKIDTAGQATDITAAFLAAGRVACEHSGETSWMTTVWLGDIVRGTPGAGDLCAAGEQILLTYHHEPTAATPPSRARTTVCQGRCQHSIADPHGEYFCALAGRGEMDESAEEWIDDQPEGLAVHRAQCYQWTSDGAAGIGCPDYRPNEPWAYHLDYAALWAQLWTSPGLMLHQMAFGDPAYYIERPGIHGLFALARARTFRSIGDDEPTVEPAQLSRAGWLDETSADKDLVQGAFCEEQSPGVPDLDDTATWGRAGVFRHAGMTPGRPPVLASAWDDDTDPTRGHRDIPQIPQLAARTFNTAGRGVAQTPGVVRQYKDIAPGIVLAEDDADVATLRMSYRSNSDGTLDVFWPEHPLSCYEGAVISGTVADAWAEGDLIALEIANTWQTVPFVDVGPPVTYGSGTVCCGGGFARAAPVFQLAGDSYFGDGGNVRRGCCEADIVTLQATDPADPLYGQGFYVERAVPFGGSSEASLGWNGNPAASPPSGAYLPTNFDVWGLRRDVVYLYDPDGIIANPATLVGLAVSASADGVIAPTGTITVRWEVVNSNSWNTVGGAEMTINRLTGRITLSAVITAAMIAAAGAAGEINVTVDAPIMDRRQQVSAADVATTVAALEALDTFEVPVDGAGGKIRLNVAHDEAQCANVWGGYTSEYPLPTVWEEGHYYEYSNVPTIPISSLELYVGLVNAPTSYHRSEVDYTAMHYPLTPGGPMETIPDGTTIASAYVKMTLSDIDETILTYSKPGGSAESLVSTDHTVGALDSVGVAIIGYRPGEDVPDILFISGGVAAEDDETVLVDVTSFAQEWVNSLRASGEYYGFSLAVIAPELGADPSFDDLSAMLPVFNYSHYEPSHIDCVPYPQPFEEGTPNPNFMDAAWTRTERTLVIGGATIHGVIVTVASLPATVGGKSIADMAPPVNSEHFGRVIRPVVAPE